MLSRLVMMLCWLGLHRYPPWTPASLEEHISGHASMFVMLHCVRCERPTIRANFEMP